MQLDQRQHAHALLDLLPPEKLGAVHSLLEILVEPLSSDLASSLASAPMDDEELTDEMVAKLKLAEESTSKRIPHEDVLAEFGIRT